MQGTSAYVQKVAMAIWPGQWLGKIALRAKPSSGESIVFGAAYRCALGTGGTLRQLKQTLLTCFEVVAYSALLLLLPSVVAGLVFDWIVTEILAQIMLVAVAGTACLTAMAIHEGWYFDHLSGWGLTRNHVEPSFTAKPPSVQAADGREARSG